MFVMLNKVFGFLNRKPVLSAQVKEVRHQFVDHRQRKDYLRRQKIKELNIERLRLNSLRKNSILPPELQALAHEEVIALPRDSDRKRLTYRCVFTSRSKNNVRRYKLSRIAFRHLADYNYLAGWQRAVW